MKGLRVTKNIKAIKFEGVSKDYETDCSFNVFPKIPEMLETRAHKKFNFQHTAKLKCHKFTLYREIKMLRN